MIASILAKAVPIDPSITLTRRPWRRSASFGVAVALASNGLSQQEVLQHKLPLSPHKRTTADLAGYFAIGCLRPSFDFDDLIQRFAVRASECVEATDTSHNMPPIPTLPHWKLEQERCHAPLS